MKLLELYECIEAIYRAGWDDCLEGRPFNPQIPSVNGVSRRYFSPGRVFIPSEGQDSGSGEIVP